MSQKQTCFDTQSTYWPTLVDKRYKRLTQAVLESCFVFSVIDINEVARAASSEGILHLKSNQTASDDPHPGFSVIELRPAEGPLKLGIDSIDHAF